MIHLVEIINHRILHIPYFIEDDNKGYDIHHDMYIPMSEIVSWDAYSDTDDHGTYTNYWIKLNISLKNGKTFNELPVYFKFKKYDEDYEQKIDDIREQMSRDFIDSNQEYLNDVQDQAFRLLLANNLMKKNT